MDQNHSATYDKWNFSFSFYYMIWIRYYQLAPSLWYKKKAQRHYIISLRWHRLTPLTVSACSLHGTSSQPWLQIGCFSLSWGPLDSLWDPGAYLMSMAHSHSIVGTSASNTAPEIVLWKTTAGLARLPGQHRGTRYSHLTDACPERGGGQSDVCPALVPAASHQRKGRSRGACVGLPSTSYKECKEKTRPKTRDATAHDRKAAWEFHIVKK